MAEHKVFSACPHDCPDTCAMITTVRDGKAIDVRGNPMFSAFFGQNGKSNPKDFAFFACYP